MAIKCWKRFQWKWRHYFHGPQSCRSVSLANILYDSTYIKVLHIPGFIVYELRIIIPTWISHNNFNGRIHTILPLHTKTHFTHNTMVMNGTAIGLFIDKYQWFAPWELNVCKCEVQQAFWGRQVGHTYSIAAHIMGILILEGCNYHLLTIYY